MTRLTLTQRVPTPQRLDMHPFTPERLMGLSLEEIRCLPINVGNRARNAGELFDIAGEPGERVHIVPAADNLDGIGAGMSRGDLTLDGNAGHRVGVRMAGGTLSVLGSTGDEAGTGMTGGRLLIEGSTGERLGGPTIGATRGMSGGLIRVTGDAGDRVGERLRRGIILIQGNAGSYCGTNMIAGTIVAQGTVGPMAGSGMRRGTLLLSREPKGLPATFNDNGVQELGFLRLLLDELDGSIDLSTWSSTRELSGGLSARRHLGDIGDGGMGEIIWPAG